MDLANHLLATDLQPRVARFAGDVEWFHSENPYRAKIRSGLPRLLPESIITYGDALSLWERVGVRGIGDPGSTLSLPSPDGRGISWLKRRRQLLAPLGR